MARYYQVHSDILDAILEALRRATEEERSFTIFMPKSGPDFFLVGETGDAPDMIASGCVAMFSMQAHPEPQPEPKHGMFYPSRDAWVEGYKRWLEQSPMTDPNAHRAPFDDGMCPCWGDREEEVK